MDNRQWMYMGRRSQSDYTNEWMNKTNAFLNRVFGKAAKSPSLVLCPYNKCANRKRVNKDNMGKYLLKNGFTLDYTRWVHHGKAHRMREEVVRPCVEAYDADVGVADMLDDAHQASTPSLSQIRARSTSASPAIRPRPSASQQRVDALEARLEEEARQRQDLAAQLQFERAAREA
ncbi:uncharacterized protein [Miscanthus floridulus]|uniref:uncharacterized protein n=1 Tax=Miscanthus floridulus TaxID=154761 RepID=UPI00345A9400